MKLIIQIPCYNEEDYLAETVSALPKSINGIDEIETLVIDDGSTDKTVDVANWVKVDHIVKLNRHQGLAAAFKRGLDEAVKLGADIIVNTDADNQYCADDIEKIVEPILKGESDVVIGARPIDSIKSFSWFKKLLQKFGSAFVRFVSGCDVVDAPSGFRAFSKSSAVNLYIFDKYSYTMESILQAKAKNFKIVSVPVRVNDFRRESRLIKNVFQYIRNSVTTILRMFLIYKPFKFFGILATFLFLAGVFIGLRYLYFMYIGDGAGHVQSLILSSIFILSGIQTGIIAFLADLNGINRKLLEDIQLRLKFIENYKDFN